MKKYITLLFLFGYQVLCAQQKELDSLLDQLNKAKTADTTRLNLLNDIAYDYSNINPEEGMLMADSAIALAQSISNVHKLATAYDYKGINYISLGNDSVAINFFNKCLELRRQQHDESGVARAYNHIGISWFNLTDYHKALQYQQMALHILKRRNDSSGMASSYNSIGINYLNLSDYTKSFNNFIKALTIFEKQGNKLGVGRAYSNIGIIYRHLKNYATSQAYTNKALHIFEEQKASYDLQNALGNMGNIYGDMDSLSKTLHYYQQALAINKEIDNKGGIASDYLNIGITYHDLKNYQQALDYLQRVLQLDEKLGNKYRTSMALSYIANTYCYAPANILIHNGVPVAERYVKAIAYQRKGLVLSEAIGDIDNQVDAWENISEIYESKKDFNKALQAYKTYISLRDSVMNNNKKAAITRMEMQYEFDKKAALIKATNDKKAVLAAAEINRQRTIKNATMGGTGALVIAALSGIFFYKRRRDAVQQTLEAEFRAKVAETEMKALRSQMNPHFIFNSLNSIGDYIDKHDINAADYYLTKFASLMRMILEHSEKTLISLTNDLTALELYMQLECMRLNNKCSYEIKVDKNINPDNTLVPPLILQPFVENSIWHGITNKEGTGKITVYIQKKGDMIKCIVEDDGIGREKAGADKSYAKRKSLGMKITKARIDIINKLKKSTAEVETHDLAEGTRVEVTLPLELSY